MADRRAKSKPADHGRGNTHLSGTAKPLDILKPASYYVGDMEPLDNRKDRLVKLTAEVSCAG